MQDKILFYQAASELPDGLSLADYEHRFYSDNAGKEILSAAIITPTNGQALVYNSSSSTWVNGDAGIPAAGATWGALAGA